MHLWMKNRWIMINFPFLFSLSLSLKFFCHLNKIKKILRFTIRFDSTPSMICNLVFGCMLQCTGLGFVSGPLLSCWCTFLLYISVFFFFFEWKLLFEKKGGHLMTLIRSSVVTINGVYAGNFLKLCIRNPMMDSAILTSACHAILFFISFA